MGVLKNCLFVFIPIILSSCLNNSKLLEAKKIGPNTNLNLNGYYYWEYEENKIVSFFLYRNGIYLKIMGYECNDLNCYEKFIEYSTNKSNENSVYNNRFSWGTYEVNNSIILIKDYFALGYGGYTTRTTEAMIKSETEIIIHAINGEPIGKKRIYKFHPYFPKPDSTNNFIK